MGEKDNIIPSFEILKNPRLVLMNRLSLKTSEPFILISIFFFVKKSLKLSL